jgi:hypothetical protein
MGAKKAGSTTVGRLSTPKRKRPGIHAKCKRSVSKGAKNYAKAYRGQGR